MCALVFFVKFMLGLVFHMDFILGQYYSCDTSNAFKIKADLQFCVAIKNAQDCVSMSAAQSSTVPTANTLKLNLAVVVQYFVAHSYIYI